MLYKYNNGGEYVYGPETDVKDKGALTSAQAHGQLHMIKSMSQIMISGRCTDVGVGTKSVSNNDFWPVQANPRQMSKHSVCAGSCSYLSNNKVFWSFLLSCLLKLYTKVLELNAVDLPQDH